MRGRDLSGWDWRTPLAAPTAPSRADDDDESRPEAAWERFASSNVFRRLYDKRILYLRGPIEDTVADTLVAEMMSLDADNSEDITLYINSPGGIVSGMFAIYDVMHLMNSKVNTICVG